MLTKSVTRSRWLCRRWELFFVKPDWKSTDSVNEISYYLNKCRRYQTHHGWQFLANVNMSSRSRSLFAVARRPVRPSVVCLNVRRPAEAVQIFGNISTALGTLAVYWHKFHGDRPRETPPPGELNTRWIAKYSFFWPIDGYISETVQDRR